VFFARSCFREKERVSRRDILIAGNKARDQADMEKPRHARVRYVEKKRPPKADFQLYAPKNSLFFGVLKN
jgi:hypothetical protein